MTTQDFTRCHFQYLHLRCVTSQILSIIAHINNMQYCLKVTYWLRPAVQAATVFILVIFSAFLSQFKTLPSGYRKLYFGHFRGDSESGNEALITCFSFIRDGESNN